jgi:hypothetical protein
VRSLIITLLLASALVAQTGPRTATYEERPAVAVANDKIEFMVFPLGASLASIVMQDDAEKLNPLWNPVRFARELGRPAPAPGGSLGVFVCVDGFGQPSAEERAAGFPGHGEAHAAPMEVKSGKEGRVASVTLSAKLPIMQEQFTRTFSLVDGESVVYVQSQLENLMGFDRPVNWAEHATIGSPFLAPNETVVDMSGSRAQTRNFAPTTNPQAETIRRLVPKKDFTWPMAPGLDGAPVNMRLTPENPHFIDHTATLMDPSRKLAWATAINLKRNLIVGFLFRREEYPWLQNWDSFSSTGKLARGLEFATQPYDVSHREVLNAGPLFDTPTFRWLPAKSKIESRYLVFYARVPQGFIKVDDVRLENGQIVVEDKTAGKQIALAASMGL